MLILARSRGQEILIGNEIRVRILDCRGRVRLGIDAPATVTVDRGEVRDKLTGGQRRDKRNTD